MLSKNSFLPIYILMLAILAILTSNMYVPAMPLIQHALQASTSQIQLSLSFYMLGLALSMIFYGPAADLFGYKTVLAVALALFILGNVLALVSTNALFFIVSRMLQACGAAGALSLWQALASIYFPNKTAKLIATGYIAIGFVPALSPFIGGFLATHWVWQSVFVVLAVYGAILLCALFFVPAPEQPPKQVTHNLFATTCHNYWQLLRMPQFMLLALLSASLYSMIYVFMAQSPILLHNEGYSTKFIGSIFIPISAAFIAGGYFARRFANYPVRLIYVGKALFLLGVMGQVAFLFSAYHAHWLAVITPFTIMTVGTGMMIPVIVSHAMSLRQDIVGSCASLLGFLQNLEAFILSAASATLVGLQLWGLLLAFVIIMILVFFKGWLVITKRYIPHIS